MLKYMADVRSLINMALTTFLLFFLWQNGSQMSWPTFLLVYGAQLLLAVIVAVMSHNHQHLPMWRSKFMNLLTDLWLSMFYGFPIFAWIPTHNKNHHVHINTDEDYTRTYRVTEKNNFLTLITYPSISGYFQQKPVYNYYKGLWSSDRTKFFMATSQILVIAVFVITALVLNWKKALLFVIIPQQISLYFVLIFNYVQHIHADEETKYNNSRNFTGAILNFLLLNNGYHTAHHISGRTHWSELKEKHASIVHKIHPSLNEENFFWFLFRVYFLGSFIESYSSKNMRLARMEGKPIAGSTDTHESLTRQTA